MSKVKNNKNKKQSKHTIGGVVAETSAESLFPAGEGAELLLMKEIIKTIHVLVLFESIE